MSALTKRDLSEKLFDDNELIELVDTLLFECVGNVDKKRQSELLAKIKAKADNAYYELSGEQETNERQAQYEYQDYVASVHHAAM